MKEGQLVLCPACGESIIKAPQGLPLECPGCGVSLAYFSSRFHS